MRVIAISALLVAALPAAALCRAAHAAPEVLDDDGLAGVAAGLFDTYLVMPVIVVDNRNSSTTKAVGSSDVASTAISNVTVNSIVDVSATDVVGQLPAVTLAAPVASGRPVVASPMAGGPAVAPSRFPVWVPWAAELRPMLGLR